MSDLVRFRIYRAPQRLNPASGNIVRILRPIPDRLADVPAIKLVAEALQNILQSEDYGEEANSFLNDENLFVGPTSELAEPIRALDEWLADRGNRATPNSILKALNFCPEEIVVSQEWWVSRLRVGSSIIVAMLVPVSPEIRTRLTRLMLIIGLVESLALDPVPLANEDHVYEALRWRSVVFPAEVFTRLQVPMHSKLARAAGFADLYVVRDEWVKYEAGEIAHIENVLKGEKKERAHIRLTETETTTTTERIRSTTNERDTQTTDRFELSEETQTQSSLAAHLEGKVDTSGQYGPTHVDTHLGGSLDYSMEQASERATTVAQETVARAVSRVEETVRQTRVERSLVRIRERNEHELDNSAGIGHVVGVYRWVDKIQRLQVFRYPNRFLLEFEIPEPAAYIRWLRRRNENNGLINQAPPFFTLEGTENGTPITSDHMTGPAGENPGYLAIAARYHTLGLTPAPQNRTVAIALEKASLASREEYDVAIQFATNTTMAVPDGYRAITWNATIDSWHHPAFNNAAGSLSIAVGSGPIRIVASSWRAAIHSQVNGTVGNISTGAIPVLVMTDAVYGYAINVTATCEPLPETLEQWRLQTYEAILNAYFALRRRHEEERAAREIRQGIQIEGSSQIRNREVIREELKKSVTEMLTGSDFTGRMALDPGGDSNPPEVRLDDAVDYAPEIQFIEQAFEWENLTYVLYPYFWADGSRWEDLALTESSDPEFARFLRSGSARVIVPARPGFESQVQLYTRTGILWGGGSVPAPGDDDYLSVAEEIKAQQQAPDDGIPGESWEVRLPTTLVWLENEVPLPRNLDTRLDNPPGKNLRFAELARAIPN